MKEFIKTILIGFLFLVPLGLVSTGLTWALLESGYTGEILMAIMVIGLAYMLGMMYKCYKEEIGEQ